MNVCWFTFLWTCVHNRNLKRNKVHSTSTITTTDAVVQEGDKKPTYFLHKWAPDNCNIYVASVKGKAFAGCVRSLEN